MASEEELELRTLTINRSMTQPILFLGCDRTLLFAVTGVCGYIIFFGIQYLAWPLIVFPCGFWFFMRSILRKLAKKDPYMVPIFKRQCKYYFEGGSPQFFFPAKGEIGSKQPKTIYQEWYQKREV